LNLVYEVKNWFQILQLPKFLNLCRYTLEVRVRGKRRGALPPGVAVGGVQGGAVYKLNAIHPVARKRLSLSSENPVSSLLLFQMQLVPLHRGDGGNGGLYSGEGLPRG
jgi:hypothetical protein